jgi:predicted enzyme related to lactoylglutathione lyase
MQLRHALIFAVDLPRMIAFYRDGVGLRLRTERLSKTWAEFEAGTGGLALHAIPAEIARDIAIADPPLPRSATPIKLVFETADLDTARERVLAHGGALLLARGTGAIDCLDPEGNVFQIARP